MGVATGCGCKEVYRFPHTLVSVLFYSSIPTFCSFVLNFYLFLYIAFYFILIEHSEVK